MYDRGRTSTLETMLVTLILILLTAAVFSLLAAGKETYGKILKNRDDLGRARIAISYINVKVRQNDQAGAVYLSEDIIPGVNPLVISHKGDLEGMYTYIFHVNGALFECFIEEGIFPGMDNAIKVCYVDDFSIEPGNEAMALKLSAGYSIAGKAKKLEAFISLRTVEGERQ
jgi:hypothetical protein